MWQSLLKELLGSHRSSQHRYISKNTTNNSLSKDYNRTNLPWSGSWNDQKETIESNKYQSQTNKQILLPLQHRSTSSVITTNGSKGTKRHLLCCRDRLESELASFGRINANLRIKERTKDCGKNRLAPVKKRH